MKKSLFIGANWKMNPVPERAFATSSTYRSSRCDIVVFPSALDLAVCVQAGCVCGAQRARPEHKGAFTGGISMKMVKDIGATYVLCGHSECREYLHDNDAFVGAQVAAALEVGLIPVLCIGETGAQYEKGETKNILQKQLASVQFVPTMVIAYEPIWAIGTGKTPSPKEVQETHAFIRSLVPHKDIRIIYGGSVTAQNASAFFAEPDIDGALVGGASLNVEGFQKIIEIAETLSK